VTSLLALANIARSNDSLSSQLDTRSLSPKNVRPQISRRIAQPSQAPEDQLRRLRQATKGEKTALGAAPIWRLSSHELEP
jgi:hypothetical protein